MFQSRNRETSDFQLHICSDQYGPSCAISFNLVIERLLIFNPLGYSLKRVKQGMSQFQSRNRETSDFQLGRYRSIDKIQKSSMFQSRNRETSDSNPDPNAPIRRSRPQVSIS